MVATSTTAASGPKKEKPGAKRARYDGKRGLRLGPQGERAHGISRDYNPGAPDGTADADSWMTVPWSVQPCLSGEKTVSFGSRRLGRWAIVPARVHRPRIGCRVSPWRAKTTLRSLGEGVH